MRSDKQILEIMLDNIEHIRDSKGLCQLAVDLEYCSIITYREALSIRRYIVDNRPSALSSIVMFWCITYPYYWPKYKVEPRAKWLKKHIKKLS